MPLFNASKVARLTDAQLSVAGYRNQPTASIRAAAMALADRGRLIHRTASP